MEARQRWVIAALISSVVLTAAFQIYAEEEKKPATQTVTFDIKGMT